MLGSQLGDNGSFRALNLAQKASGPCSRGNVKSSSWQDKRTHSPHSHWPSLYGPPHKAWGRKRGVG